MAIPNLQIPSELALKGLKNALLYITEEVY